MQEPQYVVPRIDILEQPTPTNKPPTANLNRIGLIGTFSWGPVGVPTRVYSEAALEQAFGGYTQGLTGWLSAHGIFKQGATMDVTVVRVAGASAKQATLTLEDATSQPSIVVTALYPGTKPISVSWQADNPATSGKLIVIADGTSVTYDNLTLDNLNTVVDSNVSVAKANGAASLPENINATPLAGGDNGATTADTDYTGANGLGALANVPVSILLCAQQSSAAVQAALLAQSANTTVANGLRHVILSQPANTDVSTTATNMATIQGIRGIMAQPWGEYDDLSGVEVSPDGIYAGILANIQAHYSPSNQVVQGLASLQFSYSDDDVYTLTQARVSPITLDSLTGNFVIRNGVSTFVIPTNGSSDDWSQINIRREFDKIETEIYVGTQWAKSSTDVNLPSQLQTWIDELLRQRKVETQEITDYQPTQAYRDPNNPRRVITKISIQPDWAADFIDNYISQWDGK